MRRIFAAALLVCFCAGCYTMKYAAPAGVSVTTISEEQPATFKKQVKVWYALWGLVPITDNTSSKVIAENNLKNARVKTEIKFVDGVISIFTGIASIVPATMTIEGNQ
ncbi:Bor family protein [candidate division KSB1 bacterium]|nr:Bor family protein [candidate division KSB1 bacterium]